MVRFNNRDISADWDGSVVVGSLDPITSGSYVETADELGGGSFGLVPYDLHRSSCEPPHNATIFITGIDIMDPELACEDIPFTEAVLRSYGPVEFVGSPPYFTVQTHDGTTWQPASFTLNATIVSGSDDLDISFKRPSDAPWPMGLHAIKPIAGKVKCKDVSAASAPNVTEWD